ncbi:MAG: phage major capsid protein [Anaerolineales bacterium]|jgi:HK97 family phage major capsid protein
MNYEKVLPLLRRRGNLVEQLHKIIDAVETEKRDLTADEERIFDDGIAEIERLNGEINQEYGIRTKVDRAGRTRFEYVRSLVADLNNPLEEPVRPDPSGIYFETKEGEIRGYMPGETMVRAWGDYNLPDRIQPEELSTGRWFKGIVTGDWRGAEAEKRVMSSFDDTLGGYLLPTPLSDRVIDLARAASVLIRAGALTLPMDTKTLILARVTSDPTGYWKKEGDKGTVSDMELGDIRLESKTLMALIRVNGELFEDAPNLSSVIENALAQALALEMDSSGMFGTGTDSEPQGLYNDGDISEVDMGTNGAAISDFSDLISAMQKIYEANGTPRVAVYSPRTWADYTSLKETGGQPLKAPADVEALKKLVSTQIPNDLTKGTSSDASVAFLGGFENVLWGLRQNLRVELSREEGESFERYRVAIRAIMRGDFNTARPTQICMINGIIP